MSHVLVDTNAYAAFLAGDRALLRVLSEAETVAVSVIVLGELHAGFRGGPRRAQNEKLLGEFLSRPGVSSLLLSIETAEVFGQLKADLKRAGTPIPINDLWIAAHAVETGRVLVPLDAHFRAVPGLRLWDA